MLYLNYDYSLCMPHIRQEELDAMAPMVDAAHILLHSGKGYGNNSIGWLDLPKEVDSAELSRIKETAQRIRNQSGVLVVVGIGGSYLGARAGLEMCSHTFRQLLFKKERKDPLVFFAGNDLSPGHYGDLLDILRMGDLGDVTINVISKSGTTTEPAVAFRIFKDLLEKRYGKSGARERIIATTDAKKGALREMAEQEGYETFVVPNDIGGRYSVLSAVGLLPLAVGGLDIDKMLDGAGWAYAQFGDNRLERNKCYQYAAVRNILYRKGKTIELLANFDPKLHYFSEWWKQLFGESEGKDNKGLFPASVELTTDLHSMGQYIQDGLRTMMETIIFVDQPEREITIPNSDSNLDGLNYLAGSTMHHVNTMSYKASSLAHSAGGVPVGTITIPGLNEESFGALVYFFEKACAISGYLMGVNPFDQPGVEDYKNNMYALLGKPGYEKLKMELEEKMKIS